MNNIWKDNNISMRTKKRIIESVAWSTASYGCESWTLKRKIQRRIEAFEMYSLRTMQGISWRDRKTNEEVLKMSGTERRFINMCKRRKLQYFGHVQRNSDTRSTLERTIQQGMMPGTRRRGRPGRRWADDVEGWTGTKMSAAVEKTGDRHGWRKEIHAVTLSSVNEGTRRR